MVRPNRSQVVRIIEIFLWFEYSSLVFLRHAKIVCKMGVCDGMLFLGNTVNIIITVSCSVPSNFFFVLGAASGNEA